MSKKTKKCSSNKNRKLIWYAFTTMGLGARVLTGLALVAISIKMNPIKYQASFFNDCVEEIRETGKSMATSVRICNGGGN